MRKITIILLLFTIFISSCSTPKSLEVNEIEKVNINFPEDYTGLWSGALKIFKNNEKLQTIPMSLNIEFLNDSLYTYQIQYGLEEEGLRNYRLVVLDKNAGQYAIDEKNGIVISAQLNDNILSSRFDVTNNLITSNLHLQKNVILYHINVSNTLKTDTTGGILHEGEEIPIVVNFEVSSWQIANLKRQTP